MRTNKLLATFLYGGYVVREELEHMFLPTIGGISSKERRGEYPNFPSNYVEISLICGQG